MCVTVLVEVSGRILAHRAYNLSSRASARIRAGLYEMLAQTTVPIEIHTDPKRLRPSDIPVAAGSNQRIKTELGWQPTIPLAQTVNAILGYWREHVRQTLQH